MKIIILKTHFTNRKNHDDKNWNLDNVVNVKLEKVDSSLSRKVIAGFERNSQFSNQAKLNMLEHLCN